MCMMNSGHGITEPQPAKADIQSSFMHYTPRWTWHEVPARGSVQEEEPAHKALIWGKLCVPPAGKTRGLLEAFTTGH